MLKNMLIVCLLLFFKILYAFDPDSVYFVDKVHNAWLFRGSSPIHNGEFDYLRLLRAIQREAYRNVGIKIDNIYIIDVSLLINDSLGVRAEKQFFKDNANLGLFWRWPLFEIVQVNEVRVFGKNVDNVVPNNGALFRLRYDYQNYYPYHIEFLVKTINNIKKGPTNNVIYIHCNGGCDRVSEIISGYRIYNGMDIKKAYSLSYAECDGMHFFSKMAIQWYCMYTRGDNKKIKCII